MFVPDRVLAHVSSVSDQPDLSATKYRLSRPLGSGGMGSVWAALDTELDREVALKVSTTSGAADELCARLRREAQVIARLEHPGIVPVHDVGVLPDQRVYYVMKLVQGERLDEWLAHGAELGAVLRLFVRVCEAVAFAHARDVIHRDLKPQNIMVGPFGEALVMDWGLAKLPRDASPAPPAAQLDAGTTSATAFGTVVGTLAFMPPEQARGELDRVDARADVYALGAILYFALSGRPPFAADTPDALQRAVVDERPPPLAEIAPRIPTPLVSICETAMARDPAARYATATLLADDVGLHLDGLRPHAHRETMPERALRLAMRHRTLLGLLAVYLLVRVLLAAW
jgi:serine/threonine protein kinase